MKQATNFYSTSSVNSLVLNRDLFATLRANVAEITKTIPNYVWLCMLFLAALLLSLGVLARSSSHRKSAMANYQYTQARLVQEQTVNTEIKQQTSQLRTNPQAATRAAQEQLHYVKPNEIVIAIK